MEFAVSSWLCLPRAEIRGMHEHVSWAWLFIFFEVLHLYLFGVHVCVWGCRGAGVGAGVWLWEYHGVQVRVRGQLTGVSLHLPPWESQGLDSGHQAWWQAS